VFSSSDSFSRGAQALSLNEFTGENHEYNGKSCAGATVQRDGTDHARPSVSRRDVSQQGRANATRRDDQLGVATTGIALSVAFSNAENSPLPLVLVALLDLVFLAIEARRYRYFDIWRTRVRQMEVSMYGPLLRLEGYGR
jgi:hypothetical protein